MDITWFRSFGIFEIVVIVLFVIFYGIYLYRIISIAERLGTSYKNVFIKIGIRTIYFGLLIVALLGPSFGQSTKEIKSVGKDIFIAVDLSQSMNAFDVQPSRLKKVKFELKNIVNAFSSDRIGLIIFSSEAFMQCPLTYDQNALGLFIETLNTGLVPNAGTDFGPPLRMALDKLNQEGTSSAQQKSKIIVLISDGEDFGEETDEIAEEIENTGIKLFTLGIGTQRGSKIRTTKGFKKDRSGQEVLTRLNPRSLKSLASKTDGKYFEVTATNNDISRLINTINQIEGELKDTREIDVSANKYFYFLITALGLILLDALLSFKTIRI